jgi:hypothetical protein
LSASAGCSVLRARLAPQLSFSFAEDPCRPVCRSSCLLGIVISTISLTQSKTGCPFLTKGGFSLTLARRRQAAAHPSKEDAISAMGRDESGGGPETGGQKNGCRFCGGEVGWCEICEVEYCSECLEVREAKIKLKKGRIEMKRRMFSLVFCILISAVLFLVIPCFQQQSNHGPNYNLDIPVRTNRDREVTRASWSLLLILELLSHLYGCIL